MYPLILVPIDGSETASCGLAEALRLAQALRSRIHLLHVITTLPWLAASGVPLTDDSWAALRTQGEAVLAEGAARARAANVEAAQQLTESPGDDAGAVIVAEARAVGASLIVCGTHGRRGLKRALLGSDAEHVVRHAQVPVLLVRDPAASSG